MNRQRISQRQKIPNYIWRESAAKNTKLNISFLRAKRPLAERHVARGGGDGEEEVEEEN